MCIYGLDISTSKVGIAVLSTDRSKLLHEELYELDKNDTLEYRALQLDLHLRSLFCEFPPSIIQIEEPLKMFQSNMSMAQTIAKLQRFNGMISYAVKASTGLDPILANVNSARAQLGARILTAELKELKKKSEKDRARKRKVMDVVQSIFPEFEFKLTKFGNPEKGADDRADAIIVALYVPA